jgi:cytochrome c peroxidase
MRLEPGIALACAMLLTAGCQPAGRYSGPKSPATQPEPAKSLLPGPQPLPPDLVWIDPDRLAPRGDLPLDFVHFGTDPEGWKRLPTFWNPPPLAVPGNVASLLGLSPLTTEVLTAGQPRSVKIKVPLGLDDPRPHLPAFNPPTLAKWELGRRLFFDKSYLQAKTGESCAGCHNPERGFTDNLQGHGGWNTPTLLNCLYNPHQFWDGRATYLEEVVQRTIDDERETEAGPFRHVWGGIVRRLRANVDYRLQFRRTFGTEPTQDAVARALATYLRTLLCGDSLYDRARRLQTEQKAAELEPAHFEALLDETALKGLGREKAKKAEVAAELHRGYRLFFNKESGRSTNCTVCHGGGNFTDNGFHNLGIGVPAGGWKSGEEKGRFATVPVGQKSAALIGAFKTPTLRALLRTGPYLHTGEMTTLQEVIGLHNEGGRLNPYLDEAMWADRQTLERRNLGLDAADVEALVLFLWALNGATPEKALYPPHRANDPER